MVVSDEQERRRLEALDRGALESYQLARLNVLLDRVLPTNRFYAEKFAKVRRPLSSIAELVDWPYTFKKELAPTSHEHDLTANLTYPRERYTRFHQTSGTHGRPLVVLDTNDDWPWWLGCWQYVLDAAKINSSDTVFLAFSFGPFIGFWSAYEAAAARGCLVVPAGGMSTRARLDLIERSASTAVFCTPSYALHMAEVAEDHKFDLRKLGVRVLVLAGEPGASTPAVRARIEQAWDAGVIDHTGASEVGPWGYGDFTGEGVHVLEAEFIAEFLSVETGEPAAEGELAELVLSNLGRVGCPVFRYRTGDLVRPNWSRAGNNRFVFLDGGVLGRTDDMLVVRGVNIFPSSVEQIIRSFPEVVEYRLTVTTAVAMDQLAVEIEDRLQAPQRIAEELQLRLGLKVPVRTVPLGSLPRFEGKGRRFIDERTR
jgi:phenylacetate-CoA ligase